MRKAVRTYAAENTEAEAIAILKKHGYPNISSVKEKDFQAVIDDCSAPSGEGLD